MAEGHRERLRKRFREEKIDTIPDYIVLEMMLQGAISRKDTCDLARRLIAKFGSFSHVIDASFKALCDFPGMGEAAAMQIKLMPMFYKKYCQDKLGDPKIVSCPQEAGMMFVERYIGAEKESVMVICLDDNGRVITCRTVSEGSINAVNVSTRRIVECALTYNATSVVMAHNHMGGNATPSKSDIKVTKAIEKTLADVGIELLDHIIVANNDFISFAQSGLIGENEENEEEE